MTGRSILAALRGCSTCSSTTPFPPGTALVGGPGSLPAGRQPDRARLQGPPRPRLSGQLASRCSRRRPGDAASLGRVARSWQAFPGRP